MKKLILPLLTALCLLCPFATADTDVRYVDGGNADKVHLRQAPSRDEKSLGLYYSGTSVIVYDEAGDWSHVLIGEKDGWMMNEYLTSGYVAQSGPWRMVENPLSTVTNLHYAPEVDGMIVLQMPNASVVHLSGETSDSWSYVEFEGVKGYVRSEYLVPAEASAATEILGTTADGEYIHRYTAPGGQTIYFTAVEEEPFIAFQDVNFDGMTDIVVYVSLGASNAYAELFVYVPEENAYVRAGHPGIDYGLANFQLYPEYGIVASKAVNGYAGALFENCLFCWNGTDLELLRRAVSEELSETVHSDSTFTTTRWTDVLRVRVYDDVTGEPGGTLTYDATFLLEDSAYRDLFTDADEALWEGIR